jgi:tetratricopeptide (TPR) repeat protein
MTELDDRYGQAATSDSLGETHRHLGRYQRAAFWYQRSSDLFADIGDLHNQATALTRLGDSHRAAGSPDAADDAWRQALGILEKLDHPDRAGVRARLNV